MIKGKVLHPKLQRANLERELRKKGISPDTVDLHALIDPSLTYRENKKGVLASVGKGNGRHNGNGNGSLEERTKAQFCSYAGEECLKSNKEACAAACKECGTHCDRAERKRKAPMKKCKAPVRVIKHKRKCPRHATRCKPPVQVRAHTRKCPSFLDGIRSVIGDMTVI